MAEIRPLLDLQTCRSCDYTVGGIYMWREYFRQLYAVRDGMLISRAEYLDKGTCFSMPVGGGDIDAALDAIQADCRERGIPLRFCCITKGDIGRLTEHLGCPSGVIEYRDWADYLYPYENFLGYHGKKLVTPRNHCNRFVRDYPQYVYRALDSSLIQEAKRFLLDNAPAFDKEAPLAKEDFIRAVEILDHVELFGLKGGLLSVDGKTIGLTVGEAVGDTLYVHIEKALTEYSGAYPMLASLFAKQNASKELLYINREDDSGDEGLRKSKMEYRPCELIEKYVVCFDNI
ncbi:MAG: DUF2156 domain-containing protein [Clostridia bacterium]|nr:DUF2156 domain-containing protein [Clostridia bacterium]